MTRTHYIKIAAVVKENRETISNVNGGDQLAMGMAMLACSLADYFEEENPRAFDRLLFLKNCGV